MRVGENVCERESWYVQFDGNDENDDKMKDRNG